MTRTNLPSAASTSTQREDVEQIAGSLVIVLVEGDIDVFDTLGALGFRLPRIGFTIAGRELDVVGERCQQSAWVDVVGAHHVDFSAHQQRCRDQIQKCQQAENQRANTLLVALADLTTWTT